MYRIGGRNAYGTQLLDASGNPFAAVDACVFLLHFCARIPRVRLQETRPGFGRLVRSNSHCWVGRRLSRQNKSDACRFSIRMPSRISASIRSLASLRECHGCRLHKTGLGAKHHAGFLTRSRAVPAREPRAAIMKNTASRPVFTCPPYYINVSAAAATIMARREICSGCARFCDAWCILVRPESTGVVFRFYFCDQLRDDAQGVLAMLASQ